jgi:hypothetical protein
MWMVGVRIGVAACDWASQPTGAHPREKGSFPEYWPLREGVCRAPLTGRQEKFELSFVWLPKHGGVRAVSLERRGSIRWEQMVGRGGGTQRADKPYYMFVINNV